MRTEAISFWHVGLLLLQCLMTGPIHAEADEADGKKPRTIGDVAVVTGTQPLVVEGVGLVVGLPDTGSDPAQGPERSALLTEMQKRGLKGAERILRSPKTALVRVKALIPPGVRSCRSTGCWCKKKLKSSSKLGGPSWRPHRGDTFDVEVEAPARDNTKSLEGGWLLESWLYEVAALRGGGLLPGHVRARASGPVMVASVPGSGLRSPSQLRLGRVLGGAVATMDMDFALVTDESHRSARWTMQIGHQISHRFFGRSLTGKSFAEPKDARTVFLHVPPVYKHNMGRFFEVVTSMPLYQSPSEESARLARLEEELINPATARTAAIQLEGIGRRAAGVLKKGLASSDPDVRFFAAEALGYLANPSCAAELAAAARGIPEYRAHALVALSALDEAISRIKLRELIRDSESVELRYGAFRALRNLDEHDPAVRGELLGEHVMLHQVETDKTPFVHVSSRSRVEIVLFGRELQLQTPLLLKAGPEIVLISSSGSSQLQISRFTVGRRASRDACGLELHEVLGRLVRVGATYPDLVAMLARADKNHNLPGNLELDALPDPMRLASRLRRISHPDTPPPSLAMLGLFRWRASEKPVQSGWSARPESGAAPDPEKKDEPRRYLSKRTFFDRLWRRSAN